MADLNTPSPHRPEPRAAHIAETARRARLDALLDEALSATFPASDPVAVTCATLSARPRPKG